MKRVWFILFSIGALVFVATWIWLRRPELSPSEVGVRSQRAADERASFDPELAVVSRDDRPLRFLRFEQRKRIRWAIFQFRNPIGEKGLAGPFWFRVFESTGPTKREIRFPDPMIKRVKNGAVDLRSKSFRSLAPGEEIQFALVLTFGKLKVTKPFELTVELNRDPPDFESPLVYASGRIEQ
jgi:hypothetical protein